MKTDRFARMDVNDLAEKLAQAKANGEQVMAIVATAGTTDAGAIDPLRDIARLAAEQQIWVHVDAARGGALLLSEQYRDYRTARNWWTPLPGLPQAVLPDHQLRCLLAERRAPL